MARGTMYELQRTKELLNDLQEYKLYDHLPDIAEYVETVKKSRGCKRISFRRYD